MTAAQWPEIQLGEITTKIGSGATPRGGKESYKREGTPLIRSMNVHDLKFDADGLAFLDDDQAAALDGAEVADGDVLLNITGASVARCCLAPAQMTGARVNQHVAIIRPSNDRLLGSFLAYVLVSDRYKDQLLSVAQAGATREALTKGGLEQFRVAVPPLPTQQRLAAILSAYDDLIETNTRRIAILEEMARRLYEEWFVHFRFPGHETAEFDGELPRGWEQRPLGEVCSRITDGAHKSPPTATTGLPMASVKDMHAWGLDLSGSRLISEADFEELVRNSCKPQRNDILVAKDGANLNKHTFLVTEEEDVVLLSSIAILRPGEDANPEFLVAQLKSDEVSYRIKMMRSGAAIPRIVLKDFKRLEVVVPPAATQKAWVDHAGPMHSLCRTLVKKNANLRAQRDLLLPKLVSGEIDVSGAEAALEAAE